MRPFKIILLGAGFIAASADGQPRATTPPAACVGAGLLLFDTGSVALRSEARQALGRELGLWARTSHIELTGHADATEGARGDAKIANRRAEAVRAYAIAHGFPRQLVVIKETAERDEAVQASPAAEDRSVFYLERLSRRERLRHDAWWKRHGRPNVVC